MATDNPLAFDILTCKGGASIAYRHRPGKPQTGNATRPGVIFCGGFNSNMDGTKAGRLDRFCEKEGLAYTRFDYQGHGHSSGRFEDGTIGLWFEDALAVLDKVTDGPQLIVGSSMGAWMAMLLTRARVERISGLVLLAPAPDFGQKLMWPSLPQAARDAIEQDGLWQRPSEFEDEDYPITRALIEESANHHLLDGDPLPFDGPVRILQGDRDEVVPVAHALKTAAAFRSGDVVTSIIKGADHRLSTEANLKLLENTILDLVKQV
ncbi:alpha/beta hydrolase [Aestuariispira ectoiniformans]|uniref:alpha/beta hydrolase n=1 Tax=Aestuariispira ectoiniformans TaxID=2775080 RepID=UPI00223ABDD5|nr:alpha/beta hydrolase [Aestuariispira ectoiniformans]